MMEAFASDQNATLIHNLLGQMKYKTGWSFGLYAYQGSHRALQITIETVDSQKEDRYKSAIPAYHTVWDFDDRYLLKTRSFTVIHRLAIPTYPMDQTEVEGWVFDQILLVERHEACEFFKIDGKAPYFPEHGANSDPYKIERKD